MVPQKNFDCRALSIGVLMMICAFQSFSQKAELQFVDSSRAVTRLKYYSDEHLHTSSGAIPYNTIYSVRLSNKDRKKAEFFLEKLDSVHIKVLFDDTPIVESPGTQARPGMSDSLRRVGQPPSLIASVGFGGGLDYGGFGMRGTLALTQHVHFFGGVGYALAGVGYNGGLLVIAKPKSDLSVTFSAMYGYNAARTTTTGNDFYYGPSLAIGARYLMGKQRVNYWQVNVIYPWRTLDDHMPPEGEFFPVLVSFGFNFGIRKN